MEKVSDINGQLTVEQEDERLKQLGIRRELRKEFTNFSTISFALGILGCVLNAIPQLLSLTHR